MKAIEFQSRLSPEQTLSVPANVAERLPQGQPLRVLILIAEDATDNDWENLAALDFGQGYSESDAIYDDLSGR